MLQVQTQKGNRKKILYIYQTHEIPIYKATVNDNNLLNLSLHVKKKKKK